MAKKNTSGYAWERRKDLNEGEQAYNHFCKYRDMKRPLPRSKRTINQVAKETGKSPKYLESLSVRFQWVARVQAYDDYMNEKVREEQEADIIRMRKVHAQIAQSMVTKAAKRLLTIPDEELSVSDIVKMVDIGVKIERLSRGEPTESTEVQGELKQQHGGTITTVEAPVDLTKLSDEELDEFERICQKIQPTLADS